MTTITYLCLLIVSLGIAAAVVAVLTAKDPISGSCAVCEYGVA